MSRGVKITGSAPERFNHALRLPRSYRRPRRAYPQLPERTYLADAGAARDAEASGCGARHHPLRDRAAELLWQPIIPRRSGRALDALGGAGARRRGRSIRGRHGRTRWTEFHRRGVRGLRVNLYSPIKAPGGDTLVAAFAATAAARSCDGLARAGDRAAAGAARRCRYAGQGIGARGHRPLRALRRPASGQQPMAAACSISLSVAARLDEIVGAVSVTTAVRSNTRPDREWLAAHRCGGPRAAASGAATGRIRRLTMSTMAPSLVAPYRALSYETPGRRFRAARSAPM